ncbi:MAG: transcription termination/antitermination protein NusA [Vampirovibrionales bacterium]|nr:transcription termination/antitermination protein NusA [Vampirovibrionales bacterium]
MIKIGSALLEHAEQLERERGIPKDVTVDALKEAMLAAYKRYAKLVSTEGYECRITERSGEIGLYQQQLVVAQIDPDLIEAGLEDTQMLLSEARKLKADAEVGDILETEVTPTPDEFGRIAAQSAKQVITQKIREAEKFLIMREFEEKKNQVTTGIVQRIEGRNVIINIGKSEAVLPPREQLPGEYYRVGNKLRVFVADIRDSGRVPQIVVSQSHPEMVREIFELEVPEIEDNVIEIKNIAREAGFRTKVAVSSNDPEVDPQGACIGARGSRIQAIVNELKNEKIDIIRWSDDPVEFIVNALAPARIAHVYVDYSREGMNQALVVAPDDQLSLAIGREGQNVRLAAKLTGYKLDIKGVSAIEQEGLPLHIYEQYYGAPQSPVEGESEVTESPEDAPAEESSEAAVENATPSPEQDAPAPEGSAEEGEQENSEQEDSAKQEADEVEALS